MAAGREGCVELGDLVTRGLVVVEIVFAVEAGEGVGRIGRGQRGGPGGGCRGLRGVGRRGVRRRWGRGMCSEGRGLWCGSLRSQRGRGKERQGGGETGEEFASCVELRMYFDAAGDFPVGEDGGASGLFEGLFSREGGFVGVFLGFGGVEDGFSGEAGGG